MVPRPVAVPVWVNSVVATSVRFHDAAKLYLVSWVCVVDAERG